MQFDWKKIALVIGFIAFGLLMAILIYVVFFRSIVSPEPTVNSQPPTTTTGTLTPGSTVNRPISATGNDTGTSGTSGATDTGSTAIATTVPVISEPALAPSPLPNGDIVYYSAGKDKFLRVNREGTVSEYNSKAFFNVSNVTWSPDHERAILEYPDGSNIIYDFSTGRQVTLPAHWREFGFSPTGERIAFKSEALDPENRALGVANYDGSQSRTIEAIGTKGDQFDVTWSPNNQMVGTFQQNKDGTRSEVYFIGQNNENFKVMIVDGQDFTGTWSPDGNRIVYSVYNPGNDYRPELWVADASPNSIGDNRRRLDLETWGDKCTFGNTTEVYCAVPRSLPFGAGLDRDASDTSGDLIYRLNLETGAKAVIASTNVVAQELFVANSNELVVTGTNGTVYKVTLP